jgi:UDP-N-acetylmuramoyl-L-alanyl-D-glutamate--2,6-diaminopimelate ligase
LVFTNITHDHLDYHKTFTNYLNAKLKLFKDNPEAVSVLNLDDKYAGDFRKDSGKKVITFSLEQKGMINAKKIKLYDNSSTFIIDWLGNTIETKINLAGSFNISNALAAFCVAFTQNISPKSIVASFGRIKSIPGRMEYLDFGQNYKIIVDFAHTPDGLEKVFESLKIAVIGKIIHVGGATGDRDRTKRPILGAIAGKYADVVIVTDEDPGMEKPEDIINEVGKGVIRGSEAGQEKIFGKNFYKILDRSKAIEFALSIAKKNDIVLITGKGHEQVMKIKDKLVPYSDQEVIEKYFKSNNAKQ